MGILGEVFLPVNVNLLGNLFLSFVLIPSSDFRQVPDLRSGWP